MRPAAPSLRGSIIPLYAALLSANAGAWALAWLVFAGRPALFAAAALAYLFGLRHAFDADHIAAIDNVTRRLMHRRRPPIGVGLFFSLGHSSAVTVASALIALSAGGLGASLAGFARWGGALGTSASALFLFAVAAVNLAILADVWRLFRGARSAGLDETALRRRLDRRGPLTRLLAPLFRLISRSWHAFPLGILFALGFDTASEVALFGMSASVAARGLPLWTILIFPALFTAAMTLADTTDGVLMAGAYGWAFVKPIRKVWYNLTITLLSVVIAVFVGSVEVLGLIGDAFGYDGPFWRHVAALGHSPETLGVAILAILLASWIVSSAIYKLKRFDDLDPA